MFRQKSVELQMLPFKGTVRLLLHVLQKKERKKEKMFKGFVERVELLCFWSHDEWKKCLRKIILQWDSYWNVMTVTQAKPKITAQN